MANNLVKVLSLLFGTGSWIAITGLWLEMPLLLQHAPEGWQLASYLNIMIQFANIGPIVYWILKKFKLTHEIQATHIQLFVGFCSCLLLITSWDKTIYFMGKDRSIVLFVSTFGLALVDCTSSVTFLPFMAIFESIYLTPYLVGEGLSGFIPSIVALLQGVGDDSNECNNQNDSIVSGTETGNKTKTLIEPRFSVEVFFSSLLITLMISWISFVLLQHLPVCKKVIIKRRLYLASLPRNSLPRNSIPRNSIPRNSIPRNSILTNSIPRDSQEMEKISVNNNEIKDVVNDIEDQEISELECVSEKTYIYLLCLMTWCCLSSFGFMPSIQPYSSLPYGPDNLHYVVILSGLSYPLGCFVGMFIEKRSLKLINFLTLVATLISIYIIICSLMSPNPPLIHSFGGTIMIISWICFTTIVSYTKTMITLLISDYNGDKGLFWVGMNTQFGAAFGATLMFLIISYTNVFQESHC